MDEFPLIEKIVFNCFEMFDLFYFNIMIRYFDNCKDKKTLLIVEICLFLLSFKYTQLSIEKSYLFIDTVVVCFVLEHFRLPTFIMTADVDKSRKRPNIPLKQKIEFVVL